MATNSPVPAPNAPAPAPPQNAVQAAAVPPAPVSNPPVTNTPAQNDANGSSVAPQQPQQPAQTNLAKPPVSNAVSNPVSSPDANHPTLALAQRIRSAATVLSGGPKYKTTIDPETGVTTRTPVPMRGRDLALSVALEMLGGAARGLSVAPGVGVAGRAAGAGYAGAASDIQQQQAAQAAQAKQDFDNQTTAIVRQAAAFKNNSQTILNSAHAEKYGIDSMNGVIGANKSLLKGYSDQGQVSETNVSQDALNAGLASKKYDPTKQTGIPDGIATINGRPELTYSIVENPSAKIPLTQVQYDQYADNNLQGFPKGVKIADGFQVPGTLIAEANNKMSAINLLKTDFSQIGDTLSKSKDAADQELAKSIPNIGDILQDKSNGPVLQHALLRFQRYMSHSAYHGGDLYTQLQAMQSPSMPDPMNPKQTIVNKSAPFANTIVSAIGGGDAQKGWQILSKYHDAVTPEPIKNVAQAQSIATDPASTPAQIQRAKDFLALDKQQKSQTAGATAQAKNAAKGSANGDGNGSPSDVATIGEALAKGSLTEDMVPGFSKIKPQVLAYLAQHHPNLDQSSLQMTSEERKRKDLAVNATNNLNQIANLIQSRPDLLGKVNGRISQGKQIAGTNDGELSALSTLLGNYGLASTGAHGIRNAAAREEAEKHILNSFKNGPQAVLAAIDAAKDSLHDFTTAGKPRGIDGSPYVYKAQPSGNQPSPNAPKTPAAPAPQPPAGATMKVPGSDGKMHWSDGKNDLGVVN